MPVATILRRSRAELHERLEARLPEIEQTILARAHSVADPTEAGDPTYVEGLRGAISAGLRYGLSGIEGTRAAGEPIPPELVSQVRLAVRNGVSLDTVLRRYFAGYTLLGDFVIQEAKRGSFEPEEFQRLLRTQAELFDRLIVVVSEEFRREAEHKVHSSGRRKAECVARLLAGELVDTADLAYDLDGWHLGVVVVGPGAEKAIGDLADPLDRRLLTVRHGEGGHWAWLGGQRAFEPEEIEGIASAAWPARLHVAIGEPGRGLAGWRLTHRQASAALPVLLRSARPVTLYADVCLLASMLQDEVLATSLRQVYIAPLERERDGGATFCQTLRAYFAADRNVSSTAAALGVSRKTVTNRLYTVERRLGRQLSACALEMEAALRLYDTHAIAAVPAAAEPPEAELASNRPGSQFG